MLPRLRPDSRWRWGELASQAMMVGALVLVAVLTCAAVWQPATLLILVAALALGLTFRYPRPAALALLLSGPVLTSTFGFGSLSADNVLVLAGLALVGILAVVRGQLPFTRWSLLPLVLAGTIFVTGMVNGHPNWEACLRFLSLATVPWVVTHDPESRENNNRLLMAVLAIGALSVLAQPLIGYPLPFKDTENTGLRFGGLFGHPNFAAYALSMSVLYVISLRLTPWRVAFLACAAAALLNTGSITAILVLSASIGLVLARSFKRLLIALLAAGVFLALAGQTLLSRLDFAAETAGGAAAGSNSGAWRLGQWNRALRLLEGHEGVGIGWGEIPVRVGNGLGAHNAYVQLVVELGWAATVALAVTVLACVMMSRRSHVLLVVWGYVLLTSMSDPVLFYPSSMTILLFILAAVGARQTGAGVGQQHVSAVDAGNYPVRSPNRT